MATTTNYGWDTPDDTDLVKDGAAAIRTLGSSADTTVKALSPGTTAGDLDYYTSGTAKARLGIGTAGQILQVNSGATAPEWATPAASTPAFVGCQLFMGASVTLSNNSFTSMLFAETDYLDTDAFHDPASNNSRITIPVGKAGKYLVFGQIVNDQATNGARIRINLNGSVFLENRFAMGGEDFTGQIKTIITLAEADYVELIGYQNSGGNNDAWGTTALGGTRGTAFGVQFLGA
jgi:hypothetical protein